MGETPDELKYHVEQIRGRLDQNLNQLEYRLKASINWRTQFERHPWAFLGTAFGGALLLALTVAGSRSGRGRLQRSDQLAAEVQ